MFETMNKKIGLLGLLPVIKIEDPDDAVNLAKALNAGGIHAAEVTFRTTKGDAGLQKIAESIAAVVKAFPDMLVGAGTVINPELAKKAVAAGAKFIVSPGFNPATVDWCIKNNVPVYPGVNCASQIEGALAKGLSVLKFFPAEASGGVKTLNALSGPFPQVKFMATGGVNEENISDYMRCKSILSVGGSWMVKSSLIDQKKWHEITELSKRAVMKMLGFRFAHVGINFDNPETAAEGAHFLNIFGCTGSENSASWFCGDNFELMKKNGRGIHGHIGFFTWNIERALDYLSQYGFSPVKETAKWNGTPEKSDLLFVYLDKGIAGFDVHLKKA